MLLNIFLTILLVLLNGFFVAAEFAIVKVRLSQIQVRAQSSFSAKIAEGVVNNLDGYLAATQLGITLASLGLGWIGEDVVTQIILAIMGLFNIELDEALAHKIALPLAFALITVLHIIFGELAPKSLAIRFPTNTTLVLAGPLRLFYIVFRPFIWMLNGLANLILKGIGITPVPHSEVHSEEELKLIIAESAEGGAIDASERELIQNVFDFDDRLVRQVLRPRLKISAMREDMPIEDAAILAIEEGYSRYPVYRESMDAITGFVLTKEVLSGALRGEKKLLSDIKREALFIPVNKKISQLLRLFQEKKTQMAIVINEFGGTVGMVTLEDVLEEIVGEIQDEHDLELPIVERTPAGTFRVQAQNPVDEINEMLPLSLPVSNDYVTLSGLLLNIAPEMPKEGTTLTIQDYEVKILKMFHTSPEVVELTLLHPIDESDIAPPDLPPII
jgi:CBS domain containing-hemolysin-like protein